MSESLPNRSLGYRYIFFCGLKCRANRFITGFKENWSIGSEHDGTIFMLYSYNMDSISHNGWGACLCKYRFFLQADERSALNLDWFVVVGLRMAPNWQLIYCAELLISAPKGGKN
jgi:hypothetical protein